METKASNPFDEFKKELLEKQFNRYADGIPDNMHGLLREFLRGNGQFAHEHFVTSRVLTRYLALKTQLTAFGGAQADTPRVGDRIHVTGRNGKVYPHALITSYDAETNRFGICVQPYIPFVMLRDQDDTSPQEHLSMSVSGGYFMGIDPNDITFESMIESSYWTWGSGACANGGIYVVTPTRRWQIATDEAY